MTYTSQLRYALFASLGLTALVACGGGEIDTGDVAVPPGSPTSGAAGSGNKAGAAAGKGGAGQGGAGAAGKGGAGQGGAGAAGKGGAGAAGKGGAGAAGKGGAGAAGKGGAGAAGKGGAGQGGAGGAGQGGVSGAGQGGVGGAGTAGASGTGGSAGPTCTDQTLNGAETDVDCGGPTCPKCADGLECVGDDDCKSGLCDAGKCITNECQDGTKNGAETDVDCGGPECATCADGKDCTTGSDCKGGACDASGKCTDHCADGSKDVDETDVDCGGATCKGCDVGGGCKLGSDCTSGFCDGTVCVDSQCKDLTKDGSETDVDCGGGACDKCDDGKSCLGNGDCASDLCLNGTCIAAACGDAIVTPPEQCDEGASNKTQYGLAFTQGTTSAAGPLLASKTASAYYDYKSASSHTGNEDPKGCVLYFYRDLGTGILSLIVHCSADASGISGAAKLDCTGLPEASVVVLSDDSGELKKPTTTSLVGSWGFNNNSDGGVVSGLEEAGQDVSIQCAMSVSPSMTNGAVFLLPDGKKVAIDPSQPFVLEINAAGASSCRANCTIPVCGDGVVDPGEACDDGAGGLCPDTCQLP